MLIIFLTIIIFIYFYSISKPSIKKSKKNAKPPFAKLVYSDTKGAFIIKSQKLKLRGKPDIVYKSIFTRKYIPIELKSGSLGKNSNYPREGDLMQLIAYFFMIEEEFNVKVPYGKLVYTDNIFIVYNSKSNRNTLLSVINDMRTFSEENSCFEPNKKICNSCTLRYTVCEYYSNSTNVM